MRNESSFDAILITWMAPHDMAIDLRRNQTTHKVVSTPVIGMIVKGDDNALEGFARWLYRMHRETFRFDENRGNTI